MAKTKMKKPEKQYPVDKMYHYNEVIEYIEEKYKIEVRDFSGHLKDKSKPYEDFWHWVMDNNEVSNGSPLYIHTTQEEENPDFVNKILKMLDDEFKPPNNELELWCSW